MTRSNWSLTASASAARMHVGPLSRLKAESGDPGTGFSQSSMRIVLCAQDRWLRNLLVVANVKIALSVQSKKLDKLDYE